MDEGDPPAPRSEAGLLVDQPVALGVALGESLVEIGDTVADVVNAGTAAFEKTRDRSVRCTGLEQFDLGAAEGNGDDARPVGDFERMGFDVQHVTVEWQRRVDALDRDADVGDGSA